MQQNQRLYSITDGATMQFPLLQRVNPLVPGIKK